MNSWKTVYVYIKKIYYMYISKIYEHLSLRNTVLQVTEQLKTHGSSINFMNTRSHKYLYRLVGFRLLFDGSNCVFFF